MAEEVPQQPKSSGSGCLKAAGIGCLVVLIVGLVGGFFVVKNAGKLVRVAAAKGVEFVSEAMFVGMEFPAEEKEAAMVPLKELAAKIRNGEVTAEQGGKIAELMGQGPVGVLILVKGFESKYLVKSGLSDEEKATGRLTLSRFGKGMIDKTIEQSTGEQVMSMVKSETPGSNGQQSFKETLTDEEVKNCLAVMKSAADRANVENKEFTWDLAGEIRKAIEQGMTQGAAEGGTQ